MKNIHTFVAFILFASVPAFAAEGWMTDLDSAFAQAAKEKKPVLVEFTGSDWCPPCIEMHKKVFSKKSFITKASKDFILVTLDFPNGKPEVKKKNTPYAKKYKISAFPTVVLFDETQKEFHRFTASQYPSVKQFLAHLKGSLKGRP